MREHPNQEPARLARIFKRLRLDREQATLCLLNGGSRFLDAGCGYGRLVFLAKGKFSELYGIDISAHSISRGQEMIKKLGDIKAYLQVADLNQRLPFEDGYFDAVSCVATLEWVINPILVIREFNRVLRTGGVVVITAANIAYIVSRFRALLGKPPKISVNPGLLDSGALHYFTLGLLVSLLEQQGFIVVKKGTIGRFWFLRDWWPTLLGSGLVVKAVKE